MKRLEDVRSIGGNTLRSRSVVLIKNSLNSPSITFNFQNKLYFQSDHQSRQHALYSHKARYNRHIRILVRMVQIIWLVERDECCQKCQTIRFQKPSKSTICNSLQTELVWQIQFNTFSWSFFFFLSLIHIWKWNVQWIPTELGFIKTRKFSHMTIRKQTTRDVCCMNNERRIHKDMKIAQDDSTVKLGYFVRCGLPLHVSERIPEQALSRSVEGRPM